MKKIIIASLFLALSLVGNAKTKKITPHIHKEGIASAKAPNLSKVISSKKAKVNKNICRITCTITGEGEFGNEHEVTVTAGSIFTSCETAGERACQRAYDALTRYMNNVE